MKENKKAVFYSPSALKAIFISVISFGLFDFIWIYKNWQAIRSRTRSEISPFWRTVFTPLSLFELFSFTKKTALKNNCPVPFNITIIYTAFILMKLSLFMPDPAWIFFFPSFLPLLHINSKMRIINEKFSPSFRELRKISCLNWLTILPGIILFLLMILVIISPE